MTTRFENSTLTFDWTLDNFGSSATSSPTFNAPPPREQFNWRLLIDPKGYGEEEEGFVTLYLIMDHPLEPLKVDFRLGLVDNNGVLRQKYTFTRNDHTFDKKTNYCLKKGLIKRDKLLNPIHGLLFNGSIRMRCEIFYDKGIKRKREEEAGDALELIGNLRSLLTNGLHSDVVLKVGGNEIKAHRNILALSSPVFRAMFEPETKESNEGVVDVQDISHEVLRTIVAFIYTGKVKVKHCSVDLLKGADFYDIKKLKAICEKELTRKLTNENAVETLIASDKYSAPRLRDSSLRFIVRYKREVKRCNKWKEEMVTYPHLMVMLLDLLME